MKGPGKAVLSVAWMAATLDVIQAGQRAATMVVWMAAMMDGSMAEPMAEQ